MISTVNDLTLTTKKMADTEKCHVEQLGNVGDQLDEIKMKHQQSESRCEELEGNIVDLKQSRDGLNIEKESLLKEIDELQSTLHDANNENKVKATKINLVEEQLLQVENLCTEKTTALDEASTELDRLQEEISSHIETIKSEKETNVGLSDEKCTLTEQLDAVKKENLSLMRTIESDKETISELTNNNLVLTEELKASKTEMNSLKNDMLMSKESETSTAQVLINLREEIEKQRKEIDSKTTFVK